MQRRHVLKMFGALAAVPVAALPGTAWAAGPPEQQLLYFNHTYGVFDRETADAIEHSTFLREFANFQVRTTTGSGGQVWTGRYLMGRQTYVELLGIGDVPGPDGTLGAAGLGLSVERAGELATVRGRLPGLGVPEPIDFLQTRDFGDGVKVPWFDAVLTTAEYDAFGAWAMEYRPEYFADPRSNTEHAAFPGDVGRERYLSDDYRKHLMRDITGVHLAVTPGDLGDTVPLLKAGGFRVRGTVAGGQVVASGGGTTIRFEAVPRDRAGLKRLDLALNRAPGVRREHRIGKSTLVVGPGARAVWTFDGVPG
ncbi:DUF5829 family protein [Streptomyces sp. NPDC087440]|uniref:DUF5829 family protein n=1 Tax=Streptomyces sp. NPDC087440 TaxID=3365790 RepID=UPI0038292997